MSHPKDRRDRFIIGQNKAEKRVSLMFSEKSRRERPEVVAANVQRHRDTTKRCGRPCCTNPRHNGYKDRLTMQEKKFLESLKNVF
jgi:hypothetical protein